MKKMLSLVMALCLVCALGTTAFAGSDSNSEYAGADYGTLRGSINTSGGTYSSQVTRNRTGNVLYAGAEIQNINGSTLRENSVTSTSTRASGSLGWPAKAYAMYGCHYIDDTIFYTYTQR